MTQDPSPPLTEIDFVERYRRKPIAAGKLTLDLGQFVAMEELLCEVDVSKRQDPEERLRFLAGKLGRDALDPVHHYLLPQTEPGEA